MENSCGNSSKQKIALLGSTGSIGEQTLDIIRRYDQHFEALVLTSNRNWERLAEQAVEFMPDTVVIADKSFYPQLKERLEPYPIKVFAGEEALCYAAGAEPVDTVVNALVGYAGLAPTVKALEAGKKLALANKESLVVAGDIVMRLSIENNAPIIPVDSEHSAIFQCLSGEVSPIKKVILTASGGPFRQTPANELANVTVEQALKHPNWEMGAKITIDSATMMNKGFEVIEAKWLFGLSAKQIEVIVHPQSIVHSFVEFGDGAMKAQLGTPDMHLPIQYALTFPYRWDTGSDDFTFPKACDFTFHQPDTEKFPALKIAYEAMERGGNSCCIVNAANEIAVAAFLESKIKFTGIPQLIEATLSRVGFIEKPTLDDYHYTDSQARETALSLIPDFK